MSPISESIIVAVVTGLVSLIGTIITVYTSNSATQIKIQAELDKHNAVQDERITELTREVRRHNDFAERIPKLETRVESLEKRLDRMENDGK